MIYIVVVKLSRSVYGCLQDMFYLYVAVWLGTACSCTCDVKIMCFLIGNVLIVYVLNEPLKDTLHYFTFYIVLIAIKRTGFLSCFLNIFLILCAL